MVNNVVQNALDQIIAVLGGTLTNEQVEELETVLVNVYETGLEVSKAGELDDF